MCLTEIVSPEVKNFTEHAKCDFDIEEKKLSIPMNPEKFDGHLTLCSYQTLYM